MARYQYETSPRKLEPMVEPRHKKAPNKKKTNKKSEKVENEQKKSALLSKHEKAKRRQQVCLVLVVFSLLIAMSYRNSLITEEFKSVQDLKADLSSIEKENKQLEISIEGSLNLNVIEKIASEQLGMQKQTVDQTIYTDLPKEDYVESSTEETEKESKTLLERILEIFK